MAGDNSIVVILAMSRSGTHFLRAALGDGAGLVNLDEPFNPDLAGRTYNFGHFLREEIAGNKDWRLDSRAVDSMLERYFERLKAEGKGKPVLIDIKDDQLKVVDWPVTQVADAPRLLRHILRAGYPIVRVDRRDLLAQFASIRRATKTGEWVMKGGGSRVSPADAAVTLDFDRAKWHIATASASNRMIRRWIARNPQVLYLTYETMIENDRLTDEARRALSAHLGRPVKASGKNMPRKLSAPLGELVTNLDEILDKFAGTKLGWVRDLHRESAGPAPVPPPAPPAEVAIIVTNYKRPQNLPRIVRQCLESTYRPDVIVIDNADDDSLRDALDLSSGRVDYRPNYGNVGAGHRFTVAAGLPHRTVIALDDDLFLTAKQIDRLIEAYETDPGRVHGVWGEAIVRKDGKAFIENAKFGMNGEIDIVDRAYAFDPALAAVARDMVGRLGFADWIEAAPADDVLLSFASDRKPRIHDFGALENCATSDAEGIAQWRQKNFHERRWNIIMQIAKIEPQRALGRR